MDFYKIVRKQNKRNELEIYPQFIVRRSKDLMVRGRSFYAVWDEVRNLWSTDEYDIQRLIDKELSETYDQLESRFSVVLPKYMGNFSTNSWVKWRQYLSNLADNYTLLDQKLTFSNQEVTRNDFVSKKLPYPLEKGPCENWEELISTLYDPPEREKLEWAIGAIVAGDAKDIQKFIVIYGEAGGGKSTILNIIQKLFDGYYVTFEAKALTDKNNTFATEAFGKNPLVAIQHDGDLSRISDSTRLNSIVSHEEMTMNEKFKPSYSATANAFLFMGTNQPVKISDSKSGIIRRLIDVNTSGRTLVPRRYEAVLAQINFELGHIAHHCLDVYRDLGKNYYANYRPMQMIYETDYFFNFVEEYYADFASAEYITLSQAFEWYKEHVTQANYDYRLSKPKFRAELRVYFQEFHDRKMIDGKHMRSVYIGFRKEKFISRSEKEPEGILSLVLDRDDSIFDKEYGDMPAQYALPGGTPGQKWANVKTKLCDLDTRKLHYVKVPPNHIVIDFDLKDEAGNKSAERNMEAANLWPKTYAEFSKSGAGIHLHYIYDGDPKELSRIFDDGIEVKVSVGDSSIRRQLSKCNNIPFTHISSGLPLKGKKVIDFDQIKSERSLRELIQRNLRKEIHPATKPSIDFIYQILEDAYESGLKYDITQLRPRILAFAANSTNQSEYCVEMVARMKFQSDESLDPQHSGEYSEDTIVFFDVEVFENLFVVSWKYAGEDNAVTSMINPSPQDIESFMKMKLVGFNCRRYDNHILYARFMGQNNAELFATSSKIVGGSSANAYFGAAYSVSYTDVYDFSSKKQSLKAFEVELGINHNELNHPWNEPVPEDKWDMVVKYCEDDVRATEAVFNDRKQDWIARQILADLSGLSVNDTTKAHTAKIIFGDDKEPWKKFVYTDLSETFPGYKFENGKSIYRGEDPSEGGYVYAVPGMYSKVALLDVASMHPSSILALNLFGPYTPRYKELLDARLAIKRKEYDKAKTMLGGILNKYLDDPDDADALAYALKIHALNIVYGLTSAKFPNPFKDDRNIDNIVAKRGALFMIDLKHALQERGVELCHIKTDSVKLVNPTPEDIYFVKEFGTKYGYEFEYEALYDKFCLVNNAVYVAQYAGKWTATGAEFIHPYVFKTLFSNESTTFEDLCETKSVTSPSYIYLDMNEGLPDVSEYEKELIRRKKGKIKLFPELSVEDLEAHVATGHNYIFVGKVGSFCPIKVDKGGGVLLRKRDDNFYAITGTKGYRWLQADLVKTLERFDDIDTTYHTNLVDSAAAHISEFGDLEWFLAVD